MDHYHELKNMVSSSTYSYSRLGAGMRARNSNDNDLTQLLLEERESPLASRPKELDHFFSQVYEYFTEKGLACLLTGQVLNICTLAFTWIFSGFFMLCIDWSALHDCSQCMSEYVLEDCSDKCVDIMTSPHGGAFYVTVVSAYLAVLLVFLGYRVLVFCKDFHSWFSMQNFFNHDLGISDRDLMTIEWAVVAARLIDLQKRYPAKFIKEFHDEQDITSRIMRKDNYMIALIDGPLQGAMHFDHPLLNRLMGPKALTHTLEWNVRYCVVEPLFDSEYRIDPRVLGSPHLLQRRLYTMGLINLVLSPFIVMFVLIYFALKNVQRYHADPRTLSTRSWSLFAKYAFRRYNELPHRFQRRITRAIPYAEKYVQGFASPLLSIISRFVAFIASAMLAILISLWILNEQMMKLDFYFLGLHRNLYWYMGMFAMGLGVARSFIIQQGTTHDAEQQILSCAAYTTYLPPRWKQMRLSSPEVYHEFTDLFMLNVAVPWVHRSVFLQEMLGVIMTPFILWWVLPDKAHEILLFLRNCTVEKPSVKSICSFADFSNVGFNRHGTSRFGTEPAEGAANSFAEKPGAAMHSSERDRRHRDSLEGKFEKSFVGFKASHPQWQPPAEGQELLHRLMQTVELHSQPQMHMHPGGGAMLGHSGVPGSYSVGMGVDGGDGAASAAANFIASSQYIPPEQAEEVHNTVLQRYREGGGLLSGRESGRHAGTRTAEEAARRESLGLSNGGRWGGGGNASGGGVNGAAGGHDGDALELSLRGGACRGRQPKGGLEVEEQVLTALLMEYAEQGGARGLRPARSTSSLAVHSPPASPPKHPRPSPPQTAGLGAGMMRQPLQHHQEELQEESGVPALALAAQAAAGAHGAAVGAGVGGGVTGGGGAGMEEREGAGTGSLDEAAGVRLENRRGKGLPARGLEEDVEEEGDEEGDGDGEGEGDGDGLSDDIVAALGTPWQQR